MKRLSVKVIAASSSSVDKPVYCEIQVKSNTVKTKVFKGNSDIEQTFTMGSFSVTDTMNVLCKEKRSGELIGSTDLSLDHFMAIGNYDHTLPIGTVLKLSLQLTVAAERSGGGIRRSTSIQNIKGKLSKFLSGEKEKKNELSEPEDASSIKHSRSHMGDLSKIAEEEPSKVKRTVSDEALDSKPRRRRRKTARAKGEDGEVTTKPKRSRKAVGVAQTDITNSPKRERRKRASRNVSEEKQPSQDSKEKPTKRKEEKGDDADTPKKRRRRKRDEADGKEEKQSPSNEEKESKSETKKEPKEDLTVKEEKKDSVESEVKEKQNEPPVEHVEGYLLQPMGAGHKFFGTPLDEVMASQKKFYPSLLVPAFFEVAANIIKEKGNDVTGIFRIRGKIKEVKELKSKIDNGEGIAEGSCNIHLLATLMKAFLRELPVPILTFENYDAFIGAHGCPKEEQIQKLSDIMHGLPTHNFNLLKFLFSLLHNLSLHSEQTQMTADNLAKVISPNLIWKETIDIMDLSAVQDTMKGNELTLVIIQHHETLFS